MSDQNGNGREVRLWCSDFAGVVELDDQGIPVVFRRRCRNRECCPPREGAIALHRWTIYGVQNDCEIGKYVTEYVAMRPASELFTALDDALPEVAQRARFARG